MSISNSSSVVTDGLTLYLDTGSKRSWIGAPITNLLSNKNFTTGWAFSDTSYNSSLGKFVSSTANTSHYCFLDSSLISGTVYTQSVIAKAAEDSVLQITPSVGFDLGIKYANYDLSSGTISGNAGANASMTYLGSGWYRCSYTDTAISTTNGRFVLGIARTPNSGRLEAFVDNAGHGMFLKQPQLEAAPFASPFVENARANTECILDLMKNHTITANSLTYNSDGTFSFNGTTDFATISAGISFGTNPYSISIWCRRNGSQLVNASIISQGQASGPTNWQLEYTTLGNIRYDSGSSGFVISSLSSPNLTWTNIVIVRENTGTNGIKGYVNGVLANVGTSADNLSSSDIIKLGSNRSSTVYSKGDIGNVMIYNNYALSQSQVLRNFSALRGRYGV